MRLRRLAVNPIVAPRATFWLEEGGTFNPGVIEYSGRIVMLYRALSKWLPRSPVERIRISTIMAAESSDGVNFSSRRMFFGPEYEWEAYATEDPRITRLGGTFFVTYTAVSRWPPRPADVKLALALTEDFRTYRKVGVICPYNSKAGFVFPEKYDGKYVLMLTLNPDNPPSRIVVVAFDKVEDLLDEEFWRTALQESKTVIAGTAERPFVEVGTPPIDVGDYWLVFLPDIVYEGGHFREFRIAAALLDRGEPWRLVAYSKIPLLVPEVEYELTFSEPIRGIAFPTGAIRVGDRVRVYYGAADRYVAVAEAEIDRLVKYLLERWRVH